MHARIWTQTLLEVAEKHDQTVSTCSTPRTRLRLKLPTPRLGPMRRDTPYTSLASRSRFKSADGSHVGDLHTGTCQLQTDGHGCAENSAMNGSNHMQACDMMTKSGHLHPVDNDSACQNSSDSSSSTCNSMGMGAKSLVNHEDGDASDAERHEHNGGILASISSLEALCNVIAKVCVRARVFIFFCARAQPSLHAPCTSALS